MRVAMASVGASDRLESDARNAHAERSVMHSWLGKEAGSS